MKIFMTGGTGFVGSFLSKNLAEHGHDITILTRQEQPSTSAPGRISFITGDPKQEGPWMAAVPQHDWVINLAGASINKRWTEEVKKQIYDSRILSTQNLVKALAAGDKHQLFCSTSAPGYYGARGDEELTEASPPGEDFLAQVAQDWEAEALKAQDLGIRTVITRFGLVMGKGGGFLDQLVPLFKSYLGGPVGSGEQWLSWIHQQDQVRAFLFVLEHQELAGPVNFTAPKPVRNRDFAKALGQVLNRPAILPAPAFMLHLLYGEFADAILTGQRVLPQKLLAAGFEYQFPTIDQALQALLAD
ncbi:MAG: TIGR01777 family oxidoreductase [Thermodesulfobacteriota bacterium]